MNTTLLLAIIGAASGGLGTVLGILNTWHDFSKGKVRLRVTPSLMPAPEPIVSFIDGSSRSASQSGRQQAAPRLRIEIANLSTFAVTISEAGVGRTARNRRAFMLPEAIPGKELPVRLEPHESVALGVMLSIRLDPAMLRDPVVYAKTDCGEICYGTSPVYKKYVKAQRASGRQA